MPVGDVRCTVSGTTESRTTYGLLGIGLGDVHLLDLGLVDFLGRHLE